MVEYVNRRKKISKFKALNKVFVGHLPIKSDTVLFQSFFGMYNDNPKYISMKLHELYPNIKIIWVKSDKKNHDYFPDYVETVEFETLAYYKWSYQANVVVDNMHGIRGNLNPDSISKRAAICVLNFFAPLRKKNQYNISTWHGTPLKRLGLDRHGKNQPKYKRMQGSCDSIIVGCSLTKNALKTSHFREFPISFKMYGTPRNDILLNKSVNINILKKKLSLPADKKIILYAPTFRDYSVNDSGVKQMHMIDFSRLFEMLHNKFGGKWCFVFRVHHTVITKIDTDELCASYPEIDLINGNIGDDMAEYLACSDILITDYSSSMFDFALSKKPVFLFAPDKEHYGNDAVGFYLSMDSLPFSSSCNNEELLANIAEFEEVDYNAEISEFLKKIGNIEDGHASERVVEDIKYFLDTGIKR